MFRGIQRQTCFVLHEYDRKACRGDKKGQKKKDTIQPFKEKSVLQLTETWYCIDDLSR